MRQSKLFTKTSKTSPKDAESTNHILLTRGGYIHQTMSGVFSMLPLGKRVLANIMEIIRQEMDAIDGQEVLMPSLIPQSFWKESNRWDTIDPPLFKLEDRHGKSIGLGSTHEEIITDLARSYIESYKDLPKSVYQMQTKFRNEMRSTGGLLRLREFIMKDLYSFHDSQESLDEYYEKIKQAYLNIFSRCGIQAKPILADSGTIGGESSHEFAVIAKSGEDKIVLCQSCSFAANTEVVQEGNPCPECKKELTIEKAIECGHIFKLGTIYSDKMTAHYLDKNGDKKPVVMGCYGIGVHRLLATCVEINSDQKGIIWPLSIAPFTANIIPIITKNEETNKKITEASEEIYKALQDQKVQVLLDDFLDKSPGERFSDSDLLGIPFRIVISEKTLAEDKIELKKRDSDTNELLDQKQCIEQIKNAQSGN